MESSLHGGVEQLFLLLVIDSRMGGEGGERGAMCADFELGNGGTGGGGGFGESGIGIHLYILKKEIISREIRITNRRFFYIVLANY